MCIARARTPAAMIDLVPSSFVECRRFGGALKATCRIHRSTQCNPQEQPFSRQSRQTHSAPQGRSDRGKRARIAADSSSSRIGRSLCGRTKLVWQPCRCVPIASHIHRIGQPPRCFATIPHITAGLRKEAAAFFEISRCTFGFDISRRRVLSSSCCGVRLSGPGNAADPSVSEARTPWRSTVVCLPRSLGAFAVRTSHSILSSTASCLDLAALCSSLHVGSPVS